MMLHIEPLGTECILPAFVVGYELPLPTDPDRLPHLPRWLITLDQQAGGMAMSYPRVVGAVLRLEANQGRGKQSLKHLIRGLKCMAQDPQLKILQNDYPVLRRIVCSVGNEYTRAELGELEELLSSYLLMPAIQSGIEAFIRCVPCDPAQYFAGWKMLGCTLQDDTGSRASIYSKELDCYFADDSSISDLSLTDEDEFNAKTIESLVQLAITCGKTTASPDVFLLWENAD